jgi:predicted short-subunit dehydrogenase-like oxidoreductase (DUF2520 family)
MPQCPAASDHSAEVSLSTLRLGIVGAGALGGALARLFVARGVRVTAVAGRLAASAERVARAVGAQAVSPSEAAGQSDLTILAVPDDAVSGVATAIAQAGGWRAGSAVVHTSGALDTTVLAPASQAGALVGVLHPLQTVADAEASLDALASSAYGIEAEEPLLGLLEALVHRVGGRPLRIPGEARPLYHLAAALASNATVALFAAAVDLLERAGVPASDAGPALLPLLRGTVENLERGPVRALTGAVARGDAGTVERHRRALAETAPDLLGVYDGLARRMVELALAKGSLDPEGAWKIREALEQSGEPPCR